MGASRRFPGMAEARAAARVADEVNGRPDCGGGHATAPESGNQQSPRDGAPGRNCWSQRRIGDLNPGGPQGPTALAVPLYPYRPARLIAAKARNRRPSVPESSATYRVVPGFRRTSVRASCVRGTCVRLTGMPLAGSTSPSSRSAPPGADSAWPGHGPIPLTTGQEPWTPTLRLLARQGTLAPRDLPGRPPRPLRAVLRGAPR